MYNSHINRCIKNENDRLMWLHMVLNILNSQSICKCRGKIEKQLAKEIETEECRKFLDSFPSKRVIDSKKQFKQTINCQHN